jgi:hypothetical protein
VRKLEALETENHALRQLAPVLLSTNPTGQAASAELADAAGMPLPPATLRHWVAGTDDLPWFLNSGQLGAQTIVSILAKQHIELEQLESILDFGCGCGRVLRHLHSATCGCMARTAIELQFIGAMKFCGICYHSPGTTDALSPTFLRLYLCVLGLHPFTRGFATCLDARNAPYS